MAKKKAEEMEVEIQETAEETTPKKAAKKTTKKKDEATINNVAASTTLGDIDALAELKAKMENSDE